MPTTAQQTIHVVSNIGLTRTHTGGQTATVGEPSVANTGNQVFVTGNWYAAESNDAGANWRPVDPFAVLPPVDGGFCCDQTALHIPKIDTTVWLLQYSEKDDTNTLRIAIKHGATLNDDHWSYWDLKPREVNAAWQKEWFDYNHAALSDNFLYVVTNAFEGDNFKRCVVFRIPLASLAPDATLSYRYFQADSFSLRCTQGARDVMYLASHVDMRKLRIFTWPEASGSLTRTDVTVSPTEEGRYSAPGPDNRDWMSRCDSRITAGWLDGKGRIGFMWSSNGIAPKRPMPFVRVVLLNAQTKQVVGEPDIWNASYAYAYPDGCPNAAGTIGITLFRGGGQRYPSHVIGILGPGGWRLLGTRSGTHGPADGKWGDYLTCRPHSPPGSGWLAVGFTLQGGPNRTDIEPRVVHFDSSHGQANVIA